MEQLVQIVQRAAAEKLTVKAIGGRHSFNAILETSGVAINMSRLNQILTIDVNAHTIEAEAGATLADVIRAANLEGLHFSSLGSWHSQSLAGAIATSTHGSSLTHGSLSDFVIEIEAVLADGSIRRVSDGDTLRAFRCHLGQLGLITKVKLQLEPAFFLSCTHKVLPDDQGFQEASSLAREAEFFNMLWLPYSQEALVRTLVRVPELQPNAAALEYRRKKTTRLNISHTIEDTWNYALGHVFVRAPKPIRYFYMREVRKAFQEDDGFIDKSFHLFLYDQFREPKENRKLRLILNSEYAIAARDVADVMAKMKRVLSAWYDKGCVINYPRIHVRFAPKSGQTLVGLNSDRETAYIGIYIVASIQHAPQIPIAINLEEILEQAGGRPHWGKYRYLGCQASHSTHPGMIRFEHVRNDLDPTGMFRDGRFMFGGLNRFDNPPEGRLRSVFETPYRDIVDLCGDKLRNDTS
ncbi:MAG: D-arabinono-1,4-lactone oxidase [Pseudomonadota bacterium]